MYKTIFIALFLILSPAFPAENALELEALGALGGANAYLTYVSLGNIADSTMKNLYPVNTAIKMIKEILALAVQSKSYIQKLMDKNIIQGNELIFGKKITAAYTLLIEEGNSLLTYFKNKSPANLSIFQTARKKAWDSLNDLLKF